MIVGRVEVLLTVLSGQFSVVRRSPYDGCPSTLARTPGLRVL